MCPFGFMILFKYCSPPTPIPSIEEFLSPCVVTLRLRMLQGVNVHKMQEHSKKNGGILKRDKKLCIYETGLSAHTKKKQPKHLDNKIL